RDYTRQEAVLDRIEQLLLQPTSDVTAAHRLHVSGGSRVSVFVERADTPLHPGDDLREAATASGEHEAHHERDARSDANCGAAHAVAGNRAGHMGSVESRIMRERRHGVPAAVELHEAPGVVRVAWVGGEHSANQIGVADVHSGVGHTIPRARAVDAEPPSERGADFFDIPFVRALRRFGVAYLWGWKRNCKVGEHSLYERVLRDVAQCDGIRRHEE